jgi:hypothetical protein
VCSANGTCKNQGAWVAKSLITKSDAMVVVRTLEMHRGRRQTRGTENGLSTHKAHCSLPPAKAPTGQGRLP